METKTTTEPTVEAEALAPAVRSRPMLMLAGLGVLAVLAAYWPTVAEMARIWDTSDTYAHGYLIAPISLYIIYSLRHRLAGIEQRVTWWALLPMAGAGGFWLLSNLVDIQVFQQLALVTMVISLVLLLLGPAWCKVALFPLGFLYLAVPMGDGLVPVMIDHTADFVVAALRLSGIPVYRDGTFFVIPSGSWSVVSGCSGMRYLMATVTVGALFAYFNYRTFWRQALFVVVSMVVSILANWLRAYGIVMIAHLSDMKLALGVDHYIYGWVFFGIIIFLLMAIGSLWSERRHDEIPPGEPPPAPRMAQRQPAAAALVAGVVVLCMWPVVARTLAAATPAGIPPETALAAAFELPATDVPALQWSPHYAGEPAVLAGAVEQGEDTIGWHVAWYPAQTQGAELINAANALIREKDEPWRPKSRKAAASGAPVVPGIIESELRERQGHRTILVWQWYWAAGNPVTSPIAVKLYGARSQLSGGGNPGASVLLYRVVDDEQELPRARAALRNVLAAAAPGIHAAFDAAAAAR